MTLIGLYSPAPGSGKTTVAQILQKHGYATVPFAGPLKRMVVVFLTQIGYDRPEAEHLVWHGKEVVIPELGVTVRHILQTLGTEWGRNCINPGLWVHAWRMACREHDRVCVDDVRFPNEANEVRLSAGQIWLVTRPGVADITGHVSEGALAGFQFDAVIENDGTLDDLRRKVQTLL
jgi:hypothetical protein